MEQESMSSQGSTSSGGQSAKWTALGIWVLGTFWLPVGILFEDVFRAVANSIGLPNRLGISPWLIVVFGPIAALLAVCTMPLNLGNRLKLALPPVGVLLLSLFVYICTTAVFSGWPAN